MAELGGVLVGFVAIHDDELEQLFVDRAARGTGIAARLLRHGEAAIHAAGHPIAWLAVVSSNARARAFYARMGWQDRGPMDYRAEIPGGTLTIPVQRYEIDLAGR